MSFCPFVMFAPAMKTTELAVCSEMVPSTPPMATLKMSAPAPMPPAVTVTVLPPANGPSVGSTAHAPPRTFSVNIASSVLLVKTIADANAPSATGENRTVKLLVAPAASDVGIPSTANRASELPQPVICSRATPPLLTEKTRASFWPGRSNENAVPLPACAASPVAIAAPFVPNTNITGGPSAIYSNALLMTVSPKRVETTRTSPTPGVPAAAVTTTCVAD